MHNTGENSDSISENQAESRKTNILLNSFLIQFCKVVICYFITFVLSNIFISAKILQNPIETFMCVVLLVGIADCLELIIRLAIFDKNSYIIPDSPQWKKIFSANIFNVIALLLDKTFKLF